jgi:response regulator RpfG family c-di-GMP phosphodiesterase
MTVDVAGAVDDLRQLIARADSLASATEDMFNNPIEVKDRKDRSRLERVAHLVGATAEAIQAAKRAGDELASVLAGQGAGA